MEGRFTKVQWLLIVTATVFIVVVAIEEVNGLHAGTSYTCLQCRAELCKERWLGVPTSQILESDCSRWYAKGHPTHRHEWCWCGGETTHYLTGTMSSCGREHPIWGLPPKLQLEFMRGAQPAELEAFWRSMKLSPREAQEAAVTKVVHKVLDAK